MCYKNSNEHYTIDNAYRSIGQTVIIYYNSMQQPIGELEVLIKQNQDKKVLVEQLCIANDKVNKYNLFLLNKLEKATGPQSVNKELEAQKNDQLKKLEQLDKLEAQYIEKIKQNEKEFNEFNKTLLEEECYEYQKSGNEQ